MPSHIHEDFVALVKANAPATPPTLAEQRQGLEMMVPHPTEGFTSEAVKFRRATGLWVRTPASRSDRTVLHFHGGGYVMGSAATHLDYAVRLANVTRAAVLLLDYRLAPESKFPAPVEDAVEAIEWLYETGVPPEHVVLSGDSAGGGLVVATLLALKLRGMRLPRGGLCSSPWVDLTLSGESAMPGKVDDPVLSVDGLREMATLYGPKDLKDPLASPLFGDLTSLPPLCVIVGGREVLRDDARRLVQRAADAGCATQYFEDEGLVHCWPVLIPAAPESSLALQRFANFVDTLLPA